jgi:hypothetical protein
MKRRIQVCAAIRNHHELVIGIAGVQRIFSRASADI